MLSIRLVHMYLTPKKIEQQGVTEKVKTRKGLVICILLDTSRHTSEGMFIQGSYSTQRQTNAVMYVVPDRDIVFPQQVAIFTTEAFECPT